MDSENSDSDDVGTGTQNSQFEPSSEAEPAEDHVDVEDEQTETEGISEDISETDKGELALIRDYAEKFRALKHYEPTGYSDPLIRTLLAQSKRHSKDLDAFRQLLDCEYTMRRQRHEKEAQLFQTYREKFSALKIWAAFDDDYVMSLLCQVKRHSSNLQECESLLEQEYKLHKLKKKKMVEVDADRRAVMDTYGTLRREFRLTHDETKEYLEIHHDQKKQHLKDSPLANLVGKSISFLQKKPGRLRGIKWVPHDVLAYDEKSNRHQIISKNPGFLEMSQWHDLNWIIFKVEDGKDTNQ
jgi:hypothetical protein